MQTFKNNVTYIIGPYKGLHLKPNIRCCTFLGKRCILKVQNMPSWWYHLKKGQPHVFLSGFVLQPARFWSLWSAKCIRLCGLGRCIWGTGYTSPIKKVLKNILFWLQYWMQGISILNSKYLEIWLIPVLWSVGFEKQKKKNESELFRLRSVSSSRL